ncbi:MAG: carbonic anhydrase [Methylacidiphilales bacterium]|nr:carbonic anhydrase [Candidatus Methylacidiphilales bacterium]
MQKIDSSNAIPNSLKDTPVGRLLEYHNLGRPFDRYDNAQLLIGMCMDNRKHLIMPDNFAYIIRSGGANLRYSAFKVSYAISVGGVRSIAIMGHSNCGMVNLISKKDQFINGLIKGAGWDKIEAEDHFMNLALMHEIHNEQEFVLSECERIKRMYPLIMVTPLFYKVEDNKIYLLS